MLTFGSCSLGELGLEAIDCPYREAGINLIVVWLLFDELNGALRRPDLPAAEFDHPER